MIAARAARSAARHPRSAARPLWALAAAIALAVPARGAVYSMSRTEVLDRASGGLGFSYYWGHGSWSPGLQSTAAGTCTGNCPDCTHSGKYGADCSGYVCKVWSLPSTNSDVTYDYHPYSTADLINSKPGYWTPVADADAKPGDARVYRNSTSGHTYLIREVTGAGRFTTNEAKGCSYGILSTVRTDAWVTQRRALITEPAPTGPNVPETPFGTTDTWAGVANPYCTRATSSTGGLVTDVFTVRNADRVVTQALEAPAAQSGAEMCVRIAFSSGGTYTVTAKAKNDAGTSAESAPLTVIVTGTGGSPDAGAPDAGAPDAGPADAGPTDAGAPDGGKDAGPVDAGNDVGDEGDGPAPPAHVASKGCGGCGSGDAGSFGALAALALAIARRRR